ncbi:MAG: rhamnogalacturonan lyase [Nibricoccus sp.]
MSLRLSRALAILFLTLAVLGSVRAARVMEELGRGVVAVQEADGKVFVSWRLLATDPENIAFNLYRATAPAPRTERRFGPRPDGMGPPRGGDRPQNPNRPALVPPPDFAAGTVCLNKEPLSGPTWFLDREPHLDRETKYSVRPVIDGKEGEPSAPFVLQANAAPLPYVSIPLQTPEGYTPGDASVGDLDGDGEYEIVLKQEQRPMDNGRGGRTGETLLQAYKVDGKLLWTIRLGKNIREGAHYTQFMVYDLDSDGRAEVACKTADGTIDGIGKPIGDPSADHRNEQGHVANGPEFLTVFDGLTGASLATMPYVPARHPTKADPTPEEMKEIWGDDHYNRSERYLACVAYLDGERPSLVMCRGYYTRAVLAAWDFRDGKLSQRWVFDSDDGTPGNEKFRGQGNHNLSVADVDADGKDEIVYGACVIDDNGKGLYSTGWGHGDALHVGDLVPSNPGLEICDIQERFDKEGLSMRDARSGRPIFAIPAVKADEEGGDKGEGPGRGNSFNIDPRFPGAESWAAGAGMDGIYDATGKQILAQRPRGMPCNFGIFWDGDLLHELLDQNRIVKWNWETEQVEPLLVAHACTSDNGTKATPAISCDFWGDWREEVIWRTRDNKELRIYTTTIPTKHRLFTLMHDAQYRLSVAWQNVAYNQPPHPSFYLDEKAPLPTRPAIQYPSKTSK